MFTFFCRQKRHRLLKKYFLWIFQERLAAGATFERLNRRKESSPSVWKPLKQIDATHFIFLNDYLFIYVYSYFWFILSIFMYFICFIMFLCFLIVFHFYYAFLLLCSVFFDYLLICVFKILLCFLKKHDILFLSIYVVLMCVCFFSFDLSLFPRNFLKNSRV